MSTGERPAGRGMIRNLLRTKPVDQLLADASSGPHQLERALGGWSLAFLGVGAIVGAGIFATVGTAAAGDAVRAGAGPSLMISFLITAVVCGLTALCYAELAAMVPIAGSAYTFTYAALGEFIAWIVGWNLVIEYGIGNTAVAISWAGYLRSFLDIFGMHIPDWLSMDWRTASGVPGVFENAPHLFGFPLAFNLPACLIVLAVTWVLLIGIRESVRFNTGMVVLKIVVLLIFIGAALSMVSPSEMAANWTPFQPNGWQGTLTGAAIVFFAFIGFDAVSTAAEETRNPGRNIPFGIVASLVICTVLYIAVAAAFTGLMPYSELIQQTPDRMAEPLTMALGDAAPSWIRFAIAFGALVATTAVLLVFQLGQPRIFMAMARDRMMPDACARVHPRWKTPHVTTLWTGILVALLSGVTTLDEMVNLTNVGTLFAFCVVCIGVMVLRFREPGRHRPFRVPGGPFLVPLLGAASCIFLIAYLPPSSWWRFVSWLLLGLAIYAGYGYRRSAMRERTPSRSGALLAAAGFLALAGWALLAGAHSQATWQAVLAAVGVILLAAGWLTARRVATGPGTP